MENTTKDLSKFSSNEFQTYGMQYPAQFEYRVELARRIASNFKAQHLIILDDAALTVSKSERVSNFIAVEVSLLLIFSLNFEKKQTIE